MKKYLLFFCLIFCFCHGFQGDSEAMTVTASPSSATVGQSVTITVSSSYPAGMFSPNCTLEVNFGDGSGWSSLSACTTLSCVRTITHVYATPGVFTITAQGKSGACIPAPNPPYPGVTTLTIQCTSISITSSSTLPQGLLNTAYSYQVQASGGVAPYAFSITGGSLPPGLSMSTAGMVSGTPSASGTYNFTVTCIDNCPTGTQSRNKSFTILITCPLLNLTAPSVLPSGTAGQTYTYQFQSTGGEQPVTFSLTAGSLPAGLSISAAGLISGTPTTMGSNNFTITSTDSCTAGVQTAQNAFTIGINPAPCPAINITSPSALPSGTSGQAFTYQILATGGQVPVSFALTAGTLPTGLNLSASGLISGTPVTTGTSNFTITATDSCAAGAQTAQGAFVIGINPAPCSPLSITSSSVLPSATPGQAYAHQILTTGGQTPITFILASGSLPPGLSMGTSGLIAGNSTAAGTYNFTISVTDSCAAGIQQVQRAFSIVVSGDIKVTTSPSSSRITRNTAWTQNIFYTFSSSSTAAITLTSGKGIFTANNTAIGETNTPLNAIVTNGVGNVSEVLNVPVAISERAKQAGTSRVIYTRTFTDGILSVTAQIEIIVTTGAASDFSITRLQLYFENQRAEITVKRNQTDLKTFADIRFSGSGLLTGYWEVDGRILENVNQHLVYGNSITLISPKVPSLPTFSPGTHLVRFVITQPSENIPIPQALYFVTAEKSGDIRSIDLIMPEDNAEIGYSPVTLDWQNVKWAETYLIVFLGKTDEKPIFSAYTKNHTYQIPPFILHSLFTPDGTYQWRVKGYDAAGDIIGESVLYGFAFSK